MNPTHSNGDTNANKSRPKICLLICEMQAKQKTTHSMDKVKAGFAADAAKSALPAGKEREASNFWDFFSFFCMAIACH